MLFRLQKMRLYDILKLKVKPIRRSSAMSEEHSTKIITKTVKSGITFGSALAIVISYTAWKSIGWAIFHGLLSWVYVIYFMIRY